MGGPGPAVTPTNGGYRGAAPPGNLGISDGQRPGIHRLQRCRGPNGPWTSVTAVAGANGHIYAGDVPRTARPPRRPPLRPRGSHMQACCTEHPWLSAITAAEARTANGITGRSMGPQAVGDRPRARWGARSADPGPAGGREAACQSWKKLVGWVSRKPPSAILRLPIYSPTTGGWEICVQTLTC